MQGTEWAATQGGGGVAAGPMALREEEEGLSYTAGTLWPLKLGAATQGGGGVAAGPMALREEEEGLSYAVGALWPLKLGAATQGGGGVAAGPMALREEEEGRSYTVGALWPLNLRGGPREEEGTAAFPCPQGGGGGPRIGMETGLGAASGSKCGGAREEEKHRRFCYEPREEVGFSKKPYLP